MSPPAVTQAVFITGAGTGIGAALAREYAGRGARVGCFARGAARLEALREELGEAQCAIYAGDVRDAGVVAAAALDFTARWGSPDVVVANAGVSRGTLTEHAEDLAAFRAILDTNVLGVVHTFQPFVSSMRAARRGRLVGIASVAGFRGLPGSAAYSASKAAAITYLEALRVELAPAGVAVVTICPGYVETPMTESNPYPMPFLLRSDEAARRIVRAIDRRKRFCVIPWQMAIVGRMFEMLPRPVYDRLLRHAPRKPRGARI